MRLPNLLASCGADEPQTEACHKGWKIMLKPRSASILNDFTAIRLALLTALLSAGACMGMEDSASQRANRPDQSENQPDAATASPLATMQQERKLIRTGTIALEVESFDDSAGAISRLAKEQGGFVADSSGRRDANGMQFGTLTIRVPAEKFAAAIEAVKALGEVERVEVNTEDVSKAYADLETRLAVKRQTAERLRDILNRGTGTVTDILEVEREIGRVVEESESMEGERRYYDRQVALSTLTVELSEPAAMIPISALGPVGDAARDSLRVFSMSMAALIYIVVFLLPWACVGLIAFLIVRRLRNRRMPQPMSR